ncbi:MAG: hypothetical protein ACOYLB_04210 [Phototrophicaceae bacterium]
MNDNTAPTPLELVIHVDQEHTGIRLVVMLIFIILLGLTYFVVQSIISFSNFNLLAILVGVVVGGIGVALAERQLKKHWHSGKMVQLTPATLRLMQHEHSILEFPLTLETPPKVYYWGFQVKSHARVPKGWYVLATGIKRGEDFLSAFCVMSPKEFNAYPEANRFVLLESGKTASKALKAKPLSPEQLLLHQLERIRWNVGVEMTQTDFLVFVESLQSILP